MDVLFSLLVTYFMEDKVKEIDTINSKESMSLFIDRFRVLASNNRNNENILDLISKAIQKCNQLDDQKSLVKLYEIKVSQIEHLQEKQQDISRLVRQMKDISKKINYLGGLALAYNIEWYIEKYNGRIERSLKALEISMNYVSQYLNSEEYEYYVCNYSFAVENWLSKRDVESSLILEKCANYFHRSGFYRSFTQCLSLLMMIYQQTQNKKNSMELIREIFNRGDFLYKIPKDVQSIIHYFIGVTHELNFNLKEATTHLSESKSKLEPLYKEDMYSGYYLITLSYLTATYALQGKLELALKQVREVDALIEEGIVTKNLDSFSKGQIIHNFDLTIFYIKSRLQGFHIEELQELLQTILTNISKYYSNAIFFSELLLNANLTNEQLIEIKNLNNPSTKRVGHIINFLIEKATHTEEKQIINLISALKRKPVEERMTFAEKAFADLLAAQEYYKLNRFTDIYPLLKKYENQLHRIEVLELRVFMEAFIQIGAYKNGDPLGPALQYMAIKKCKNYGFSRLENRLIDYLQMQKDSIKMI